MFFPYFFVNYLLNFLFVFFFLLSCLFCQPLTAFRSGTGRPVIASITAHALPFFLTTIALSPTSVPSTAPVPYNAPQSLDFDDDNIFFGGPAANRVLYVVNAGSGALPADWSRDVPTIAQQGSSSSSSGGPLGSDLSSDMNQAMSLLAGPEEGFHVLRCRGDGSQVEIIVRKVRKREGKKSCYHLIQYKKRGLNYNTIIK